MLLTTKISEKELTDLYLSLMKKTLTHYLWNDDYLPVQINGFPLTKRLIYSQLITYLGNRGISLVKKTKVDPKIREEGRDHPIIAHTMVGLKRLTNIQFCVEDVLANDVPGDLIETGIWRGGSIIFMRAILKAYGVEDRIIWGADSFEGLPHPDADKYPADAGDTHYLMPNLSITLEQVKANFEQFDLLDDKVCFLKGWFKDTLPTAPISKLAIMRLDGDMYESTMDGLMNLYPKLSPGGYVIVDDYGYIESCRKAVHDYRTLNNIQDKIQTVDWTGVYWKKTI